MKRTYAAAFAAIVMLSAVPAFAAGDPTMNSEVGICRGRIEEGKLRAEAEKNVTKKQEILHQIELASNELASGNAAKCNVQMDKATKIDK